MPSFRQILEGVDRAWREQRAEVEAAGGRLVQGLVEQSRLEAGDDDPTPEVLAAASGAIEASFDSVNGGWGRAPKFPQPMTIEFLLRHHLATGDPRPLLVARRSLEAMADGGLRDQLGGGFHRYSTDAHWLVPHFEQMLYDNAQLARVYLHAWSLTGDARLLEVATGTLDYMRRELTTDDGAFAASQDADTDGIEGLTFTWRAPEIREVLGDVGRPLRGGLRRHRRGELGGDDDPVAGRQRRGSGRDVRFVGDRGRGRGWPRRAGGSWRDAGSGHSRPATARRWRPGTGWRSRPSPTPPRRWQRVTPTRRPATWTPRNGRPAPSSTACSGPTVRSVVRGRTAARSGAACSRTTPIWLMASLHSMRRRSRRNRSKLPGP